MGKILSVLPLRDEYVARIKEAAPGWTFIDGSDRLVAHAHAQDAEIILGWSKAVKEAVQSKQLKLKWVQNWGAGVDRLPLDKLQELGIVLTNASGVHPFPIAETIYAMLLSFTRGLHRSVRDQLTRTWSRTEQIGEAHGRTIAILGVGAIGVETAKVAKAFQMKVLGVRKSGQPAEWVDDMYALDGLSEALAKSDYVVNCLPYTKETHHLMGGAQFAAMKSSAFYINVGRGSTTDTNALLEALQAGTIAGAGLDVFEQEPLPPDHPLWTLDNVIITPHNAGNTVHYDERMTEIVVENLRHYIATGNPLLNVVDLKEAY